MKTPLTILLLAGLALASSCKKDNLKTPDVVAISGTLSGANVLPKPVPSAGTGQVTGTFDKDTNELTYSITYSGLSGPVTRGHFHVAVPPGDVGPYHAVSFAIQPSPITGKAILPPADRDELLKGNFYANLHTATYDDGEVRADIEVK